MQLHDHYGHFVFGTRNPRRDDLVTTTAEELWLTYTSVEGHTVALSGTQEWEPISQVMHWTSYRRWWQNGQQQCKVTRIATRFTFPQELLALLHYNGFTALEQYGDWDRTPFTAAGPASFQSAAGVDNLAASKGRRT
ncbi:MAG: methyltransferase type 12 [Chloroflexi bacterium]|nr:MAG: methyltransferase type 12 [Chloroflexota bacterium]